MIIRCWYKDPFEFRNRKKLTSHTLRSHNDRFRLGVIHREGITDINLVLGNRPGNLHTPQCVFVDVLRSFTGYSPRIPSTSNPANRRRLLIRLQKRSNPINRLVFLRLLHSFSGIQRHYGVGIRFGLLFTSRHTRRGANGTFRSIPQRRHELFRRTSRIF